MLDSMFEEAEGIFSVKPLTGPLPGGLFRGRDRGLLPGLSSPERSRAPRSVSPGHPRLLSGPTPRKPGIMLKSSIGMGGHNAVIVLDDM